MVQNIQEILKWLLVNSIFFFNATKVWRKQILTFRFFLGIVHPLFISELLMSDANYQVHTQRFQFIALLLMPIHWNLLMPQVKLGGVQQHSRCSTVLFWLHKDFKLIPCFTPPPDSASLSPTGSALTAFPDYVRKGKPDQNTLSTC